MHCHTCYQTLVWASTAKGSTDQCGCEGVATVQTETPIHNPAWPTSLGITRVISSLGFQVLRKQNPITFLGSSRKPAAGPSFRKNLVVRLAHWSSLITLPIKLFYVFILVKL